MKFYIVSVALLIMNFVIGQSCNLNLSGYIMDFHDNSALENAEITIHELSRSVKTDENGYFEIDGLCENSYHILVTHKECDPLQETIQLQENMEVLWFMEHHIIQLENIEIQGNLRREVDTQAEIHIHQDEINRNSAESLGFLLKSVSGVSGLETGNNIVKPMIHGMHSSRIIMMNNGVRQEDMEWGVEHSPNMDLNAFEDIRILKGGSALRYGGDAIGGIVMTEYPRLPRKDTIQGQISMTGFSNGRGGNINAVIQKGFKSPWAFQIQASAKKNGDYKTPQYYLTNTGSEQEAFSTEIAYGDFKQRFSLSYSYFTSDLGILKASHLGNLNDLANAIQAEHPWVAEDFSYKIDKPFQKVEHHLAKLKAEKRFQNFGKLEAQYAFQFSNRNEFDVRIGEVTDLPSMDVELKTHSFETYLLVDKFQNTKIETGIDFQVQDNFSNPETQIKRLIPDYIKVNTGAFISSTYQPTYAWKINAGLRYDFTQMDSKKYYAKRFWNAMGYENELNHHIIGDFGNEWLTHFILKYHNISATLGSSYSIDNQSEISMNYAFSNRPPNPAELFSEGLHHSAVSIEWGDVQLQAEKAHKVSLNYYKKFNFLEGFSFNLMFYYNQIRDYIYQVPVGAEYTIRGAYPVWQYKQIDAEISGFDFDFNAQFNKEFSWKNQLSYVHANDKTNDVALIQIPPFEWSQKLQYQWQTNKNPYVAFGTQWVAEQKRFADYNFTLNVLENGEFIDKLVDISTPPSSYFLMNLEAGITLKSLGNPLQIHARIKNIADVSYRNYMNRFRYYADEMGRQIQLQLIYNF